MKKHQMTLVSDFYKQAHAEQFPSNTTFIASYFTPRMSRVPQQELIVYGLQGFILSYLIEEFNETFFNVPEEKVIKEYNRVLHHTLSKNYIHEDKIRKLHKLGYLPIEIKALPEGTKCPMKVPCIEITNTHPDFAWVVQFIESIMSCQLWYPMTVANQAYEYRKIVDKYYNKTVSDTIPHSSAISEFGFRGAEGREGAILASSAFLTSFNKTATIEAILYLEDYYNGILENEDIAGGMLSTEHSVMCSNYAVDGNEKDFIRHLLKDLYSSENISVVSDSYDYWNMLTNIYGDKEIKDIIMKRNGTLFVRGDSGNPVDIICGTFKEKIEDFNNMSLNEVQEYYRKKASDAFDFSTEEVVYYARVNNKVYEIICFYDFDYDEETKASYYNSNVSYIECNEIERTVEMKGTVEILWEIFGGTVNEKGYKVLDSHIKAIYGDSITPRRAEEIYKRLENKGFASNNVALGAGSFSMQCSEEYDYKHANYILKPFTRDTYGIAIKSTYMEVNNKPVMVFKNPKTDKDNFKKSQKGMCYVYKNSNGEISCEDGFNKNNVPQDNMLRTVFKDGKLIVNDSIYEIRNRLHEKF